MVLKVRDANGNIQEILSLRGKKGDRGEKGDESGVYVGSGDMPDGYNVQIDPNGQSFVPDFANKSVLVETTINTWEETMTFNHEAITATCVVEMLPGVGVTAEQLAALQAANAVDDGKQTTGKASFKLMGEVPAIAIPIRFIIRRDL